MYTKSMKYSVLLLRLSFGFYFLYAGVSKIMNEAWSAQGFLLNAQTFPEVYAWLASPQNIGWVNFLNEWGLTLIGISLILGVFVRWSTIAGILLMALYYFPSLSFPYAGDHGYIVDDHIIFIAGLLVLYASKAGRVWGVDGKINR